MKTGVFFDLDGTLWDSADNVVESWNKTLKDLNYKTVITIDDMHSVMGKIMSEIADILFKEVPIEKRAEVLLACEINENADIIEKGGVLFDGVEEMLIELSEKYELFIISNCQKGYIEAFLEHYNFGRYFTDTENPGVTGLPKGENIKLVAKRNNIDQIIYVGDTDGDYNATQIAGGTFVHAAYGFGTVPEGTLKVDSVSEIPNMIYKLTKTN